MELGNKILELRKSLNLSQEELSEKMGVTRQTISKWELGETCPDIKQAKQLSNIFNISLDELVNNDIKSIVFEKVSNTEKLAGIIIKILKFFGILLLVDLIVFIIIFCLFTFVKKESPISDKKIATLNCSILDKDYMITLGSNGYFNCSNCDKKMQIYLNDITDWANIDHGVENIKTYFTDNGGSCD